MRIMREHIEIGRRYPQISINTTYSFGLDDQEFVVSFEMRRAGRLPRPRPRAAAQRVERLHFARHADLHLHREQRPARPRRARRRGADGGDEHRRERARDGQGPRSFLIQHALRSSTPRRGRRRRTGRFLRRRAPACRRAARARGPVRPPADAVRAGARRRRAGPPEDQVGRAGLREDRGEGGLPLLRRRRARARPASRRPARALPRGDLCDRRGDRPAARDPRRGPAGLRGRHDLRRLVQRPSRPSRTASSTSATASGSSSSATATSRSTARGCSR